MPNGGIITPALSTSELSLSYLALNFAAKSRIDLNDERSSAMAITFAPGTADPIFAAAASHFFGVRQASTTVACAAAMWCAVQYPSPVFAPAQYPCNVNLTTRERSNRIDYGPNKS